MTNLVPTSRRFQHHILLPPTRLPLFLCLCLCLISFPLLQIQAQQTCENPSARRREDPPRDGTSVFPAAWTFENDNSECTDSPDDAFELFDAYIREDKGNGNPLIIRGALNVEVFDQRSYDRDASNSSFLDTVWETVRSVRSYISSFVKLRELERERRQASGEESKKSELKFPSLHPYFDSIVSQTGTEAMTAGPGIYPQIKLDRDPVYRDYDSVTKIFEKMNQQREKGIKTPDGTFDPSWGFYSVFPLGLTERNALLHGGGDSGVIRLPKTLDDRPFMKCMGPDDSSYFLQRLYWTQMFIANSKTGMQLHHDNLNTHVWGFQLQGVKEFVFCPPDSSAHLGVTLGISEESTLNAFDPDYTKYPDFKEAKCVHAVLRPGDMVYWPSQWWHQSLIPEQETEVGLSVSLSGMHLDYRFSTKNWNKLRNAWRFDPKILNKVKECDNKLV